MSRPSGYMMETQSTLLEHQSEFGSWTIVDRQPPDGLQPYVLRYSGYRERNRHFDLHLQTATTKIPLIVNLGSTYRISGPGDRHFQRTSTVGSFVAGLYDGPVLVGADGPQHCLQVDLTPLGACRIFNLPMGEISNRVVGLDDLLGRDASFLAEQLYQTPDWDERFKLMSELLLDRLAQARGIPHGVSFAWSHLAQSSGRTNIGDLASELGWSHKHLIAQFREHLGLPPKKLARILRFERALQAMLGADKVCLASVAQEAGYFDQAHLHRDFREFAHQTPAELLQRRLPGMDGLIGD